ncbi:MAG TPA: hypothetical protein VJO14_04230 [Bacteroidota bacterium]|nr:hypothetical protein [Bacteroidota bacterium]
MHSPVHFGQNEASRFRPLAGLDAAAGRFRRLPASVHLLYGHSSVYTTSLLLGCASGRPVAVIDGSMRFNSYLISRLASFLGLDPKDTLNRTHVTRSFTAFQTEAAITSKLPRFLSRIPCPLVVVIGLLDTYYDEQVRPSECRESLGRVMRTFAHLARRGTHVLIADVDVGAAAPPGKLNLFALVRGGADGSLLLMHDGGGFYLNQDPNRDPNRHLNPNQHPDRHQGQRQNQFQNQLSSASHGTQQRYLHADHRQEQGNLEQIPSGAEEGRPGIL